MLKTKKRFSLSSFQWMGLGFAGLILVGALLLMLPVSSASGEVTPFTDAFFTATTSVCVTGLVVQDTGTYWSLFGQSVILILVQVGGLGVVTVAAFFAMVAGRKISLAQRSTIQEAVAAPKLGGVMRLTSFVLKTTLFIELLGFLIMAPTFISDFGWLRGIWMALFHSISAFCNAGLDLMGGYVSLINYSANPFICLTVACLAVAGGIGFLTWQDFRIHRFRFRKYRMQSKVILSFTAALILIPALGFFLFEFGEKPLGERLLASLFQAVTPRTVGMSTVDVSAMSQSGQLVLVILMLIGGAPGSTAGGMKITAFAIMLACAVSVFRKRDSVHFFGRRIAHEAISAAATVLVLYVSLCLGGAILISAIDGLPIFTCIFETASAVSTVGLSLGVTPSLSLASKWILVILMYIGRVGGLTLLYAAMSRRVSMSRFPLEKITVG